MSPLVHPESRRVLDRLFTSRPHALLITGPHGIGLATIVTAYARQGDRQVSVVLPEKNEKIDTEKGTITVQSIRRLYDATRTVEPAGRCIIIDYAERMAVPAQNAFLKLLEEPTEATQFILLTHAPDALLPTITSRAQRVDLRPITPEQSEGLLDALSVSDATKRAQLLFIAAGLPAELTRLVHDDEYFAARAAIVKDARTYVTGGAYDRLLLAKKYKDSRADAETLLGDAQKLLRRTIAQNGDAATLRLLVRLEALHRRIREQGNVRLQLSAGCVL